MRDAGVAHLLGDPGHGQIPVYQQLPGLVQAHDGKTFHFCTNACRQIFWKDRDNVNHETLVDRFLAGQIQPMDVGGILGYMGMTPDAMGDDPDYEAWTRDYVGRPVDGIALGAQS